MFNKVWVKSLLVLLLILFLGLPTTGSADMGMGYGPYPRWGFPSMHAWYHGEDKGPAFGYWGDLSEEDIQKLEKERATFFEATKNLKTKIYQKRLELYSEMAKENPDAGKAAKLQTEISGLKAEFDQKDLEHLLNMKKIVPDIGRGYGGGYGMMGPGMMHHGMMGPWGAMGPGGYGMGPGMMGPEMMGPGMMYRGWGTGMNSSESEREIPPNMSRQMGSLEEKDAAKILDNYVRSTRNPNLKAGMIEDKGSSFKAQIITRDNSLVEEILIDKRTGYMRPAY